MEKNLPQTASSAPTVSDNLTCGVSAPCFTNPPKVTVANNAKSARVKPPRRTAKHIAVVTMGVKLGDEMRGYTRFRMLAEMLVQDGFTVDLITSSFQHWEKAQRDCANASYQNLPYRIVFIKEPGYTRNLDLGRIRSHAVAAKNLRAHFDNMRGTYDLIYAEVPPNDVARVCAEAANDQGIPFVADINDLWPEAMRMVVDIPLVSDILFYPFSRDAKRIYQLLSGAVGTSDDYAQRPAKDRVKPYPQTTVYVGNDLAAFDAGVRQYRDTIDKPAGEFWVTYAGTLGASYDLKTLIGAAVTIERESAQKALPPTRIKVLGDGPDREKLEAYASELQAPVDFLGYMDHGKMAAYLDASDVVVNSLVASAVQCVVTKIGDYLASAKPMINTGSNQEFRSKVSKDGFGINVEAENTQALTEGIIKLATHASLRKIMGSKARLIAEKEFDQPQSYRKIVDLLRTLL